MKTKEWPVLKKYDNDHLAKIAMPIGGIGTGTISLGGRGDLRDWEICNAPGKGFIPSDDEIGPPRRIHPFFAVRTADTDGKIFARLLEGPLDPSHYEGDEGCAMPNHGFPRFSQAEFMAAYPFGQVAMSAPEAPVKAVLKAYNPLIPGNTADSGLPAVVISFILENQTNSELEVSVCGTVPNFIGDSSGCKGRGAKNNRNQFINKNNLSGIFMSAPELAANSRMKGDIALTTLSKGDISYRTSWEKGSWGNKKLDFWDDFTEDGALEERDFEWDRPLASLCVKQKLRAGEKVEFTFMLTWRFPNRLGWNPSRYSGDDTDRKICANWYANLYKNSWDAAEKIAPRLPELEEKTIAFVDAFCSANLPDVVKEAALFNLSTLRTETFFRTPDGKFYGWEGVCDCGGCCYGSCTHVWNYEQTTAFVFGDIAKDMRETEFLHSVNENGLMRFRVDLPISDEPQFKTAAADGQMGCIMKLYRDWQLSGDDEMLRKLWSNAKKSLEFCWIEGGWDADCDGVMEGAQHNTMDVEYFGPNPQMGFWYLGALKCAELMAEYLDDREFATKCRNLRENGAKILEARCFNGEYFEHIIEVPKKIADGLSAGMGAVDLTNPELQLGAGCLVDQLVGQYMAHIVGIGDLSDPVKHHKTLESIFKYNFKENFHGHFNHFRSYVLGDESAVLMATYPKGRRPLNPFPYANEVMTGFEYTAAVHMLYVGMKNEGLKIISSIRARYDGLKRSPFDEAECGHHYARAMAAWGAVLAITGFEYSGVNKSMQFSDIKGRYFWSNGKAYGLCILSENKVQLEVIGGYISLETFSIKNRGEYRFGENFQLRAREKINFTVNSY